MALDWNKQLSFGKSSKTSKHSKRSSNAKYPSKTTMNLYVTESNLQLNRVIPVAIVLVVLVIVFVKFGVVDQYARLHNKEAELSRQQLEVAQVEKQLTNYDQILATYQSYSSTGDPGAVDAVAALDLVTTQVMPYANVSGITLADGTLSLTITGTSLTTVGEIASRLSGQEMVTAATVSTAANNSNAGAGDIATLTIKLANADGASSTSSNSSSSNSKK